MPGLIACPSCQNKISERAPSCPKCGSEMQQQCVVCKKFIPIYSISCPECGDPNPFEEQLISNKTAEKYEKKLPLYLYPRKIMEKEMKNILKPLKL